MAEESGNKQTDKWTRFMFYKYRSDANVLRVHPECTISYGEFEVSVCDVNVIGHAHCILPNSMRSRPLELACLL